MLDFRFWWSVCILAYYCAAALLLRPRYHRYVLCHYSPLRLCHDDVLLCTWIHTRVERHHRGNLSSWIRVWSNNLLFVMFSNDNHDSLHSAPTQSNHTFFTQSDEADHQSRELYSYFHYLDDFSLIFEGAFLVFVSYSQWQTLLELESHPLCVSLLLENNCFRSTTTTITKLLIFSTIVSSFESSNRGVWPKNNLKAFNPQCTMRNPKIASRIPSSYSPSNEHLYLSLSMGLHKFVVSTMMFLARHFMHEANILFCFGQSSN